MRITIDGIIAETQPTTASWSNPRQLGYNGDGCPIYGPFRTCNLAFERISVVDFYRWADAAADAAMHRIRLPHPETGVMTEYDCYVAKFSPRLNTVDVCEAAAAGVDILLTRIQVD